MAYDVLENYNATLNELVMNIFDKTLKIILEEKDTEKTSLII
mgnify:CR=1 FL=1